MAYKVLNKVRIVGSAEPSVSITKDSIRFNAAARNALEIDSFAFATLHQDDEDTNKLAVELSREEKDHSKAIREGFISATEWIKPHNLPRGSYPVTFNKDESLVEFDTTTGKPLPEGKSKGAASKTAKKAA